MDTILQLLVSGVMLGGIYALMSIGLTLIFGVLKIVNFAHGEFLMLAMYAAWAIVSLAGVNAYVAAIVVMPVLFGFGALAYLLKDATEAEVLETVRAVHRGESRLTPQIARKVLDQFRLLPEPARPPDVDAAETQSGSALTDKEARVLQLIAEGMTNKQIANIVFLAEGTVKNYVSRIMEKLHAGSRTELAVMAVRQRRVE